MSIRKVIGWGLLLAGLVALGIGIYKTAVVWHNDVARMHDAPLLAGLVGGGVVGIVIGFLVLVNSPGGSGGGLDDFSDLLP